MSTPKRSDKQPTQEARLERIEEQMRYIAAVLGLPEPEPVIE